uniref:class A beta-lactamase n=1 Tax=uncultured Allisonella sp. TaxID=339338 RepID=UPI002584E782|nr:class A beta-lactamase [uncultured Allisonella sp.]
MRKTTKCLCRMAVCLLALSMLYPVGSQLKAATPVLSSQPSPESSASQNEASFKQLEAEHGARLGVYAWDTGTNQRLQYRADERFAYCSTGKILLAAACLQKDSGINLDEKISYTSSNLLSYAPVTRNYVDEGMTVAELCSAALRMSDNTAANLLLQRIGGIEGLRRSLIPLHDVVTCPARAEPDLNTARPHELADTTTPHQLAINLHALAFGNVLAPQQRRQLIGWMMDSPITGTLVRASVPAHWHVADKSGSGGFGTRNDAAILFPPHHAPIILVIMTTHNQENASTDDALVASAARIALKSLDSSLLPASSD